MKLNDGWTIQGDTLFRRYNSFTEFTNELNEKHWKWRKYNEDMQSDTRRRWLGASSIRDAHEKAVYGTPARYDSADLAGAVRQRIGVLPSFAPRMIASPAGGSVIMSAYLEGVPDCMNRFQFDPVSKNGRIVSMVVDGTAASALSPDAMQERGDQLMRAISAVDLAGYQSELFWTFAVTSEMPKYKIRVLVKLKSAGEYFDQAVINYALTSPTMLRLFGFAAFDSMGKVAKEKVDPYGHYGCTLGGTKAYHGLPDGTIFIPPMKMDSDAKLDVVGIALNAITEQ